MGEIVINSADHKLYILEKTESGEVEAREITEEDIAKLSSSMQRVIRSLQQQAKALQELAEIQAQAAYEIAKFEHMAADCDWVLCHEIKEWIKQGWGYKPKLQLSARPPHRAKPYWHRTRSFCVRRGYH